MRTRSLCPLVRREWRGEERRNGGRPRYGLIGTTAGEVGVWGIPPAVLRGRANLSSVHFTLLKSFEHMANVRLAVLSAPFDAAAKEGRGACAVPAPRWAETPSPGWMQGDDVKLLATADVDLLWTDHVSLLRVEKLAFQPPANESGLCLVIQARV